MIKKINCPCQTPISTDKENLIRDFQNLREKCPALREVFVPSDFWPDFQRIAQAPFNEAKHSYKILLALMRGYLGRITLPVHLYLLDGEKPKDGLISNYRTDLTEKWMIEKTPIKRHQKARGHEGKLAELLCSEWLERNSWELNRLAALGGSFDIEGLSPEKVQYSIEVKYIGEEDIQFEKFLGSMKSSKAVVGSKNIYDAYNYFLFRIYEASSKCAQKGHA